MLNPRHGYGANVNPCLDCKIFMVGKALEWIDDNGFDFIVTGEVIGQRPMSQRKGTMPIIARESGAEDRLLRPLCALNLEETLPEREGWVDRAQLKDFTGRSRKPQMALAREFGLEEYAQPSGGCCFLTDQSYSVKLRDLWDNRGRREYELDDIMLLKVGRHIRPEQAFKLIIAREEGENNFLHGYRNQYQSIWTSSHPGPLALIEGEPLDEQQLQLAGAITARFSKGRDADTVELVYSNRDRDSRTIRVKPLDAEQIEPDWVLA